MGEKVDSVDRDTRRLRLRVAAKLLLMLAMLTILYVVLSVFLSSDESTRVKPGLRVDITALAPGESMNVLWEGRPVLVYRRTAAQIAALRVRDERLKDPASRSSRQPDWAQGDLRSRQPEWFVSIGVGTDFSCPVTLVMASNDIFKGQPWAGGFADECRGSRYDLAGRVYAGQYADKNLNVPDYSLSDGVLTLGGTQ